MEFPAMTALTDSIAVYNFQNYEFHLKEGGDGKEETECERIDRLEAAFVSQGIRREVRGILLVHVHEMPHVLLLKTGKRYELPGGRLRIGEDMKEGLVRKLNKKISQQSQGKSWHIGPLISRWFKPTFDSGPFPYKPIHVSDCRCSINVFLCPLPQNLDLYSPKNAQIVAVSLYDLLANKAEKYDPIAHTLPACLSRLNLRID
eukprot:TRINITY_DN279_c0_g1_i1.p1 TRINITY_DN279_c0_g1~~TRINITY_DN279_c0_g1_i1.p1  ORF type:complete len:203 (+),score=1.08 TRINITY_DN279_c0_g1_i1:165-773(+)